MRKNELSISQYSSERVINFVAEYLSRVRWQASPRSAKCGFGTLGPPQPTLHQDCGQGGEIACASHEIHVSFSYQFFNLRLPLSPRHQDYGRRFRQLPECFRERRTS